MYNKYSMSMDELDMVNEVLREIMNGIVEDKDSGKKIYLAGGISDTARKRYQTELAQKLMNIGYDVYAAATNDSINDKSNNPTPKDIYTADINEILSSDYFVQTISGAGEDGTNFESGVVAGVNEMIVYYNELILDAMEKITEKNYVEAYGILFNSVRKLIPIIAFSTNERLAQPQISKGIPSAGYNHLILGGIDKWGVFKKNEKEMRETMKSLKALDDEEETVEDIALELIDELMEELWK